MRRLQYHINVISIVRGTQTIMKCPVCRRVDLFQYILTDVGQFVGTCVKCTNFPVCPFRLRLALLPETTVTPVAMGSHMLSGNYVAAGHLALRSLTPDASPFREYARFAKELTAQSAYENMTDVGLPLDLISNVIIPLIRIEPAPKVLRVRTRSQLIEWLDKLPIEFRYPDESQYESRYMNGRRTKCCIDLGPCHMGAEFGVWYSVLGVMPEVDWYSEYPGETTMWWNNITHPVRYSAKWMQWLRFPQDKVFQSLSFRRAFDGP